MGKSDLQCFYFEKVWCDVYYVSTGRVIYLGSMEFSKYVEAKSQKEAEKMFMQMFRQKVATELNVHKTNIDLLLCDEHDLCAEKVTFAKCDEARRRASKKKAQQKMKRPSLPFPKNGA